MLAKKLRIKLTCLILRFLHIFISGKTVRIYGFKLEICKNVFSPLCTFSSKLLIKSALEEVEKQDIMLDLGTGSGIISLVLANKASYTVASDISEYAARCALKNMKMNNLDLLCDVVICDLTCAFRRGAFSLIVFNPPYIKGKAKNDLEKAWFDDCNLIENFLEKAYRVLRENGRIIIAYSDIGPLKHFLAFSRNTGWHVKTIAFKKFLGETIYVFRLNWKNSFYCQ